MMTTFIKERPLPGAGAATFSAGSGESTEMGEVTVDDASFMIAEFENGALGSFEASRFAPGRKNYNYFEIYGSKGSIVFNLERMNELQLFLRDDPAYAQGFRTILATEGGQHDYIANWWPPGHIIGYEHEFHHAVVDFMKAIETGERIAPNFYDGLKEIEVLQAGVNRPRPASVSTSANCLVMPSSRSAGLVATQRSRYQTRPADLLKISGNQREIWRKHLYLGIPILNDKTSVPVRKVTGNGV